MKKVYLMLSMIGAIVPYVFYIKFIQSEGINFPLFITTLFENNSAAGFSADVLLATVVFWLYIFQRAKLSNGPKPLLFFVLSCTIGLSCALPAYLYANEKQSSV